MSLQKCMYAFLLDIYIYTWGEIAQLSDSHRLLVLLITFIGIIYYYVYYY